MAVVRRMTRFGPLLTVSPGETIPGFGLVVGLSLSPRARYTEGVHMTYGGDLVSTWSVLRLSCEPRSPVGLVNPPGNNTNANRSDLAIAA